MKTIRLKDIENYLLNVFKNRPYTPVQFITTEAQAKQFHEAVKEIVAKYETDNNKSKSNA